MIRGLTYYVHSKCKSMTELRQAIDQVATGARAQADHVQKATAVVSETAESIRSTDGVVHDVVSAAERMRQAAAEGAEKVAETLTGIQEVHSTILRTAEAIEALESDSAQIHQIVQTIREMADQIDLLSLNANIEAARAGEHGKGFAVVADEVRQLAERSREATQQVVRLVDTIRQGTQAAVLAMREATASGEQGQQLAHAAGRSLQAILDEIGRTDEAVSRIRSAMDQTRGQAQQLLPVMDDVAAVTEENAAMAQEMADSSGSVTDHLHHMAAIGQENAASAEEVSASAEQLAAAINQVSESAQALATLGQELQRAIGSFRV
ncbi:protein of unknown function [Candidatus Hydrogenisulfobacillus filiaventi]|uniref:Methyl-accepting transducer domain-containing protein n=1 Tax=Candidatus Hydrogenisulfobacillus filiaventi TaxID=2707344 RepID=A0A6F8ZJ81_9FIRM|nr:protein of unknown function [Candidatus Hydrogenisulfobacillus filiaventi]